MIVNLFSPKGSRDNLYLSNYATIQLRDELARLPGVGDITYLGQRDYSMRVWLDPGKMSFRNLTATDVSDGHRAAEHPGRRRPDRPAAGPHRPGLPVHHEHPRPARRLRAVRQHDPQDRHRRPDRPPPRRGPDRARRAGVRPDLHPRRPALRRPLDLSAARLERPQDRRARPDKMEELKGRFPEGLDYAIVYDTTPFITESVRKSSRPCATP